VLLKRLFKEKQKYLHEKVRLAPKILLTDSFWSESSEGWKGSGVTLLPEATANETCFGNLFAASVHDNDEIHVNLSAGNEAAVFW